MLAWLLLSKTGPSFAKFLYIQFVNNVTDSLDIVNACPQVESPTKLPSCPGHNLVVGCTDVPAYGDSVRSLLVTVILY